MEYGEDVWAPGLGAQDVVHRNEGTLLCNSFTFYTWKPTTHSTIFLIQNEKEMKSELFYKRRKISKMPIFSCHLKIICHILASKYKIQVDPWTTWGQRLSTPCSVENPFNFWLPKNLTTVIPWCPWGIGSRNPHGYQTPWCSSPLCTMTQSNAYSQPSSSTDSQPWIENMSIFMKAVSFIKSTSFVVWKSHKHINWRTTCLFHNWKALEIC